MNEIIIIGYSGHSYNILDVLVNQGIKIKGYIDKNENKSNPFKIDYLGNDESFKKDFKGKFDDYSFFPAVGKEIFRYEILKKYDKLGVNWINVFNHNIILSRNIKFDTGIYIAAGVIVNVFSEISRGVILNTGCIIEHECKIGKSSQIATGATLAGDVKIGDRSFVGANAVIKQGIKVGNDVIIGAGSVVIRDIEDNCVVAGNPSKFIRKNLEL